MQIFSDISWGYLAAVLVTMGGYLLALILIPRILLDRRGPEATLAWILIVAFVPYLGAAVFYVFGRTRVQRRTRKVRRSHDVFQDSLERLPGTTSYSHEIPEDIRDISLEGVASLAGHLIDMPLVPGNKVELYTDGALAYDRMEEAILSAKHHVHLMSYIFRTDQTGQRFRDLLVQKARSGLKVKLLVDGFGGRQISSRFIRPLRSAGGGFAWFAPILGRWGRWRPTLRNHRKILVVDGQVAFTGGLNIGDEYQGRSKEYGPWRDSHMRIEGPAVRHLQEAFAEDWFFAADEDLVEPENFPEIPPCGSELVQVISSGPDHDYATIHRVFFTAINEARSRVYITTPYFVPDPAMLMALKSAAWRGLEVIILLPGRSDMPLVQWAARSYYDELLAAGVKIYELHHGILHAKTMVLDGAWSTVGSANMDIRSFQLNFELNVLVWGQSFAERMENIFKSDLSQGDIVTWSQLMNKRRLSRFAENISRVLSPVL
ncbi:MAG: cardiolipin synthase [Deltaproteobacteria bacterium]|nr:cardiolipin synthase [Deltaproteobacteria bacterium]